MGKRARTCPITGVPLKGVDEICLTDRHELDLRWLRDQSPDGNVFGWKQIGQTIYPWTKWTEGARQFRHRVGLEARATPNSFYHLHQVCLLGVDGPGPTVYITHADSLVAGSNSYHTDAIARSTHNQSGLTRGLIVR